MVTSFRQLNVTDSPSGTKNGVTFDQIVFFRSVLMSQPLMAFWKLAISRFSTKHVPVLWSLIPLKHSVP